MTIELIMAIAVVGVVYLLAFVIEDILLLLTNGRYRRCPVPR